MFLPVAAAVLAGCTTTSGVATSSSPNPEQSAPPVSKPKDARAVPPCTLLTPTQAMGLGLDSARAKADALADLVDCSWPSTQSPISSLAVTIDTNPARQGLTNQYFKRRTFPIFEPLVVDGYPAVRAEVGPSHDCTIFVGLSEVQAMFVTAHARSQAETCALVKRAISAMLTNLPPQS